MGRLLCRSTDHDILDFSARVLVTEGNRVGRQKIEPAPKNPRIGALAMHGLDSFRPLEFARKATSNFDILRPIAASSVGAAVCYTSFSFKFSFGAEVGQPDAA